jgi:hypothetical protein
VKSSITGAPRAGCAWLKPALSRQIQGLEEEIGFKRPQCDSFNNIALRA